MAEEGQQRLEKATELLNLGQTAEALEISRTVLVGDPTNVNAKLIEAIALSQLGNIRDASEAFAQATEIDPQSVKAHFNAAIHEYNMGNLDGAKAFAEKTVELDPKHDGARGLLDRMKATTTPTSAVSNYQRVSATEMEVPYEGIAFVQKLGKNWVIIGWVLAAISVLFFVNELLGLLRHLPELNNAVGKQDMHQIQNLSRTVSPVIYQAIGMIFRFASIFWVVIDILNRRGSFFWLIGHVPCSCIGLGFVTQPLYMLLGRK